MDPQALARQDANDTASHSNDPAQWIGSLLALHDDMALRSMSGSPQPTATRKAMVKATKTLASDLLNGVRINPIGINIRVQRIRENANHRQQ